MQFIIQLLTICANFLLDRKKSCKISLNIFFSGFLLGSCVDIKWTLIIQMISRPSKQLRLFASSEHEGFDCLFDFLLRNTTIVIELLGLSNCCIFQNLWLVRNQAFFHKDFIAIFIATLLSANCPKLSF